MKKKHYLSFSYRLMRNPYFAHFLGHRFSHFKLINDKTEPFDGVITWGLKNRTGSYEEKFAKKYKLPYLTLEDGFLRSLGCGTFSDPQISIVKDDVGIYYDATKPSKLENILSDTSFTITNEEKAIAEKAISEIIEHNLTKYNAGRDCITLPDNGRDKILIIDQKRNDFSITLGLADSTTFNTMLETAIAENPNTDIYVKVHPHTLQLNELSHFNISKVLPNVTYITSQCNPVKFLKQVDKVYVATSQLGFEALILGKEVHCFGMPFYAGWGATIDRQTCSRRTAKRNVTDIFVAAYIRYTTYLNLTTKQHCSVLKAISYLKHIITWHEKLSGEIFCVGVSHPAQLHVRMLLYTFGNTIHFVNNVKQARSKLINQNSKIVLWGQLKHSTVNDFRALADSLSIPCYFASEGFINTSRIGERGKPPLSFVLDSKCPYYNNSQESELVKALNTHQLTDSELLDAEALTQTVCEHGLSHGSTKHLKSNKALPSKGFKLIAGQDQSQFQDHDAVPSNLELVKTVRNKYPDAYLIYTGPNASMIKKHVDEIIPPGQHLPYLAKCNEVHTVSSLIGFDAIVRKKPVFTYGEPFYAGWGLTHDHHDIAYRSRKLTRNELFAISAIHHPKYIELNHFVTSTAQDAIHQFNSMGSRNIPRLLLKPLLILASYRVKVRRFILNT